MILIARQPDAALLMPDRIEESLSGSGIMIEDGESLAVSAMKLLNAYAPIFIVAFLVTLVAVPIVRRVAIAAGVVDHPDACRKLHREPIPYLGGVAVFFGLIVGISLSYFVGGAAAIYDPVPLAIVAGMIAIAVTGFADDVWGWDPRLKIAGQLVAAAALAINDIGTDVASGLLIPLLGDADRVIFTIGGFEVINQHIFYWTGTAIIAIFVLGGANSANLIDGLDGLLAGIVAIVAIGLLLISMLMVRDVIPVAEPGEQPRLILDGARIVLCIAVLGAVLGFLPYNFNPAVIFLGDCGSLLLGYTCAVIILTLGQEGQTHLVAAGLIVYSIPIMDTTLAMIRRKLSGVPLSVPDHGHIHHQLKRSLGGVKRAVFALYGINVLFAVLGVTMAALVLEGFFRLRVIYSIALVPFSFIGVIAVKAARQQQMEAAIQASVGSAGTKAASAAAHHRTGEGASTPRDESDESSVTAPVEHKSPSV
jgi:UDP-GlcNAc:undecaprenyl-phosphate GlcNAc-1-phosphate transferase